MTYSEKYEKIIKAIGEIGKEILPSGSRVVLYGSRARGDFHDHSDWDIHILVPGDEMLSLEEISRYARPIEEFGWEMNEYFSVLVYSHCGWQKRHFLPFYKNVENDKIVIF